MYALVSVPVDLEYAIVLVYRLVADRWPASHVPVWSDSHCVCTFVPSFL